MLTELRLSGFGGQGVILAASILGKAAAVVEGRHATMNQAFGPEALDWTTQPRASEVVADMDDGCGVFARFVQGSDHFDVRAGHQIFQPAGFAGEFPGRARIEPLTGIFPG